MANIKRANTSGITKTGSAVPDVPDAPTIGTATDVGTSRAYNNGSATVAFTAPVTGGTPTSYTATSSPGGLTGTGASSPVTVTGLSSATAYTFTVKGTNSTATGPDSSASGSITATTVPQAPTIGTAAVTNTTTVSIPFTAGATGGKSITSYTTVASPTVGDIATSGTSSPLTVTGTFVAGTGYTFTIAATNANGTGSASSSSNSITPNPTAFESIATATGSGASGVITFSNIPSTYKALQIRGIVKDRNSAANNVGSIYFYFNGDSSPNNYTQTLLGGDGTNKTAQGYGIGNYSGIQAYQCEPYSGSGQTNVHGAVIFTLPDYASASKNKSANVMAGVTNNASTTYWTSLNAGTWLNTSAVTSISISSGSLGFATTTQFALYGIN